MGQQQLLLIVVGIIIVGIAIVVGMNLYRSSAIDTNRNNIVNELVNIASEAQRYYRKPQALGGGGSSFSNFQIPVSLRSTASGTFEIDGEIQSTELYVIGIGTEVVSGTDTVKVSIQVLPDTYNVTIIN
jgi:hypothetical protein